MTHVQAESSERATPLPPMILADTGLRLGVSWPWQLLMLILLGAVTVLLVLLAGSLPSWIAQRTVTLLTLTGIACWRWSWRTLHLFRAVVYRYWFFPYLRRLAEAAQTKAGPVPEVTVLATTYHEEPWITAAVFDSVFQELRALEGLARRPKVVVVTACDEDDTQVRQAYARCCQVSPPPPSPGPPELVLLRGDQGKRKALGVGLRAIAADNPHPEGVVVFMDGDTCWGPGLLRKILPIFRLHPPVAAVTTNENGLIRGPGWFAEWISLRLGQRHRTMCSLALSGKLLCLTGRLSAFRTSVAGDPGFRAQLEHDVVDHWLWGSYELLSGDDKTTCFWLAARGHRMLYVPDALATTIEVVQGLGVRRAYANMKRWSGNMYRNMGRLIALGPLKLGLCPWLCTVDQFLCTWVVLIGPMATLLAFLGGYYDLAAGLLLWALLSRLLLAPVAWRHGRRFSAYYIPLQVLSDWIGSLLKIWVYFRPAQQSWFNRGGRTLDSTREGAARWLRSGLAYYLLGVTLIGFTLGVAEYTGFLRLWREAPLFLGARPSALVPWPAAVSAEAVTSGPAPAVAEPPPRPLRLNTEKADPGSLAGPVMPDSFLEGSNR